MACFVDYFLGSSAAAAGAGSERAGSAADVTAPLITARRHGHLAAASRAGLTGRAATVGNPTDRAPSDRSARSPSPAETQGDGAAMIDWLFRERGVRQSGLSAPSGRYRAGTGTAAHAWSALS